MNASLKTRKNVVTFFTYLVLILGSISMIFPFVWMVLTSFKTQAESMAIPPQILPSHWNLDSFVKALQSLPFTNLYINTGLLILFRVIFTAVFAYADLMWPLICNTDLNMMTLSAGLSTLNGQYTTNFPVLMAGSLLAMIPMVILYLIFQKQFIQGIAMTGGK